MNLIAQLNTWDWFEKAVVEVFTEALLLLRGELPDLPISEDELNRKLFFMVRRANKKLVDSGRGIQWPFTYEGRNPPLTLLESHPEREMKRPDFYWAITDFGSDNESDYYDEKQFVIECKRLGSTVRASWPFNANYVKNGVRRFADEDHGYGKGSNSGAMIGYIQSSELNKIESEVNASLAEASLHKLNFTEFELINSGITSVKQVIVRTFTPKSFIITHIWVDLRINQAQDSI